MKNDLTPEICQDIRDDAIRDSTKESYQYDIKVFNQWCNKNDIKDPSVTDIIKYFEYSIQFKKYATVRRYRASLAKKYEILTTFSVKEMLHNLFKGFRKKNPPLTKHSVPITLSQYYYLIEETQNLQYKLILRLQFKSSARISEILNLTVDDIDWVGEEEWVKIRFKRRKEKDEATVMGLQNSQELGIWLNRHIQKYRLKPTDKLFQKVHRNSLKRHIERMLGEEYGTHSLRSGHINEALREGKRREIVMKTSGHKNSSSFDENYVQQANCFDNSTDLVD